MRFASAFGLPLVEQHRPCSRTYATGLGKPGINPELAGDHMMLEANTSVGTRGILNCAKVIGISPASRSRRSWKTFLLSTASTD